MLSLHVPGKAPSFPSTMMMTPVLPKTRASSGESQSASGKGTEEKSGFMANTFSRLKRKDHSQSSSTTGGGEDEDGVVGESSIKKAKSIMGKKILNGLT
jgi:hypothetical protein